MGFAATSSSPVVVALAGRRIDAPLSKTRRFPLQSVEKVRADLEQLFVKDNIEILVCSAACGADLISLDIARKRGIRFRIVLPFSVERFRRSSVIDRPGDWGPLFDEIIDFTPASDLIVLQDTEESDDAYEAATQEILRQAALAAAPAKSFAVAVWEGRGRHDTDATVSFLRHARRAGMKIRTVRTC